MYSLGFWELKRGKVACSPAAPKLETGRIFKFTVSAKYLKNLVGTMAMTRTSLLDAATTDSATMKTSLVVPSPSLCD